MKTPLIPFHSYAPDRIDSYSTSSPLAQDVIPTVDGYRPLKNFTRFSKTALTARARGLFAVKDTTGAGHIYAGDKTKLYKLINTSFTDASSSVSGTYNLGASRVWEFVRFQNRVITNSPDLDHQMQQATIGSLTFSTTLVESTDKPKCLTIGVLRDFVVGGNISSTAGGLTPSRIWWSAVRDPTDWTPSRTTQCDYQDLVGEKVQRIIGSSEYAVVFQEDRIQRMNYVGSPLIFDINPVSEREGTQIPTSVVSWGRFIFYISPSGFQAFDGVNVTPIGENFVDDEFYDYFDANNAYLVTSGVDPVLKNVFWSFPGEGNTGTNNKVFVYHWPERKWSVINEAVTVLGEISTPGYTLDGLDAIAPAGSLSATISVATPNQGIDNDVVLGPSLDSEKWKGGLNKLGGVDDSNYFGYFDGDNRAAVLETAEMELQQGRRSQVLAVRPIVQGQDTSGLSASVGSRSKLIDTVVYSTSSEVNVNGVCNQRAEGRYHRFRISLSASMSWSLIAGVQVEFAPSGDR